MADTNGLRPEDISSVGTRVSWGAVLAGAVVALALYLVLTILGGAIGLTVAGNVRLERLSENWGWGVMWAVVTAGAALFAGGCVTSMLTAGETKSEAVVHGVILWGTVVAILMWLGAAGVSGGFNALLHVAYANGPTDRTASEADLEDAARRLGFKQSAIDEMKEARDRARERVGEASEDSATRTEAAKKAAQNMAIVTWASLFGMLLSMGAAIGGAYCSSTPQYRNWIAKMGHGVARHGGVERRETVQV